MQILNNYQAKKQNSFSLIEIMIGLSIIMILCSLWPAHFFDFNRQVLMHELDTLMVTFSYLQQRAMASYAAQEIIFDLHNGTYSYSKKANSRFIKKMPDSVKFGFLKHAHGPPSDPRKPIKKAITFEHNDPKVIQATFLPNGKVTPGTIYLVDKREKNMVALTVPVSQVSYVRKYRYENNKWVCF